MAEASHGQRRLEYHCREIREHPQRLIDLMTDAGWRLHTILQGWFDRYDVWQPVGYTLIFERAHQPMVRKPKQPTAEGVA